MSSNSHGRSSEPLGGGSPKGSRGKRITLSCHVCRRRKLRCDRAYPSCSRCRKTGQASSCTYDERSFQSRNTESRIPSPPKQGISAPQPSTDGSTSNPVASVRQTSGIENTLSSLKANQTSGTWQLIGGAPVARESKERPVIHVDTEASLASPCESSPTETAIFRGANFKTQYYGGTNPTSLIAHVG